MEDKDVYIVSPQYDTEPLTNYIAQQIAEKSGARFSTTNIFKKHPLILEIGGILDRDGDVEIEIEDKTNTKIFRMAFEKYFKIKKVSFQTDMSIKHRTNYARIELTNRVRHSKVYRDVVIDICSKIVLRLMDEIHIMPDEESEENA